MSAINFIKPQRPRRTIIVVGAGISGLTAAYQLECAGHDVIVLEASDRIGGKAYTFRGAPIDPSLYAEFGARVLPPDLALPFDYADHFIVPYAPMPWASEMLQIRGAKISDPSSATAHWPVPTRKSESHVGNDGMWKKYVESIALDLGDPRSPGWPSKKVAAYDAITFTQFLRERGASQGAIEIMHRRTEECWGDGLDVGSALQLLRELAYVTTVDPNAAPARQLSYLTGGTSTLTDAFARNLRNKVRIGLPVVKIVEGPSSISAICQGTEGTVRFEGDELICTAPFSVMRSMSLPPLPPEKRFAIDLQQQTSMTRVYLQTKTPVWGNALGNVTYTDQLPMLIYTADQLHKTSKGLLEVFITGRFARAVQALPEAERIARVLDEVDAIAPGTKDAYDGGVQYSWDEGPWSRGAYPWYMPGDITEIAAHAAAPVSRLHFAGEHTSLTPGWLHGAIESGERAAAEVA